MLGSSCMCIKNEVENVQTDLGFASLQIQFLYFIGEEGVADTFWMYDVDTIKEKF